MVFRIFFWTHEKVELGLDVETRNSARLSIFGFGDTEEKIRQPLSFKDIHVTDSKNDKKIIFLDI